MTKNKLKINRASMNGFFMLKCVTQKMSCFRIKQYCPTMFVRIVHDSYKSTLSFVRILHRSKLRNDLTMKFDVRLRSQKPAIHSSLSCIVFSIPRRIRICFQK